MRRTITTFSATGLDQMSDAAARAVVTTATAHAQRPPPRQGPARHRAAAQLPAGGQARRL